MDNANSELEFGIESTDNYIFDGRVPIPGLTENLFTQKSDTLLLETKTLIAAGCLAGTENLLLIGCALGNFKTGNEHQEEVYKDKN